MASIDFNTASTTRNYANVAYIVGKPKAIRATANAIANNPISYLIPCHRVIHKSGKFISTAGE
ncbi:MAG: methylated-DNA--[protein]-cysteine S-methyltransferase [Wolbachia sp.]